MVFHGFLKDEVWRAAGLVLAACGFVLWASCGYPVFTRRGALPWGHLPFCFGDYWFLDVVGMLAGCVAVVLTTQRWLRLRAQLEGLQKTQDAHFFARAGAPRRIHALLVAVAACDGEVGAGEQEVVRRVLTRELPDRVLPQDLRFWSQSAGKPQDPIANARFLAGILDAGERDTLLQWCRAVAAADDRVEPEESDLLGRLAEVLREPPRAVGFARRTTAR